MEAASSSDIKTALKELSQTRLLELVLRLARFKKENKELLTYLLFEADDREAYITGIRKRMEEDFGTVNVKQMYLAKKSVRRILRETNKFIRYSADKVVEVELLISFLSLLKESGINLRKASVIQNTYKTQYRKVDNTIQSLHEDLQYDYQRQLQKLEL